MWFNNLGVGIGVESSRNGEGSKIGVNEHGILDSTGHLCSGRSGSGLVISPT